MGNTNSQESTNQPSNYTHGHHVIKIASGSPGEKGGLVPFFDYLVEANGIPLDKDSVLIEQLTASVGKELKFVVYNAKREEFREATISPSDWGEQTKLGVSVRFTELKPNIMEYVWHVLEISPNSPASDAGLISDHDYIIGTTKSAFTDSNDFYNLISQNQLKPIELYVYNVIADQVRTVFLTPNPNWGGSGSLGCEVGYGLIHRIPSDETRRKLLNLSKDDPLPNRSNVIPQPYNVIQSPVAPHSPVLQSPISQPPFSQPPIAQPPISQPTFPQSPLPQPPISLPPSAISPIPSSLPSPLPQSPIQSPIIPHISPEISVVTPPKVATPPLPETPITPITHSPSPVHQTTPFVHAPMPTPNLSFPTTPSSLSPPFSPSLNLPSSPFSPPVALPGSPSLETLQALKEKQARLQEQLKSLQNQA